MLIAEVPESTLDGTQFVRDYLLLKYINTTPTDCLFFWSGQVDLSLQTWLDTGILSAIPEKLEPVQSEDIYMHLFFNFLTKYPYFGSSLRMLVLYEVKTILESWGLLCSIESGELYLNQDRVSLSYNFYYPDRTCVSISLNYKVISNSGKVNLIFFKKDLFSRIQGLLTYLNKIDVLGVF